MSRLWVGLCVMDYGLWVMVMDYGLWVMVMVMVMSYSIKSNIKKYDKIYFFKLSITEKLSLDHKKIIQSDHTSDIIIK